MCEDAVYYEEKQMSKVQRYVLRTTRIKMILKMKYIEWKEGERRSKSEGG